MSIPASSLISTSNSLAISNILPTSWLFTASLRSWNFSSSPVDLSGWTFFANFLYALSTSNGSFLSSPSSLGSETGPLSPSFPSICGLKCLSKAFTAFSNCVFWYSTSILKKLYWAIIFFLKSGSFLVSIDFIIYIVRNCYCVTLLYSLIRTLSGFRELSHSRCFFLSLLKSKLNAFLKS